MGEGMISSESRMRENRLSGSMSGNWKRDYGSRTEARSESAGHCHRTLPRLRQLSPLTDDNLLIFRDRTPTGRHYTERPGDPPTGLQDSSFGAGCFGNAKSS